MANRRMFSLEIVDTDAFLDMPASTRLLYYDLGMRADDDGFLQNAQKIARYTGAGADDLRLLAAKGYIIPFENGVVVVRHWHANNQIRKDRYKPTICSLEKSCLLISKTGSYERSPVWQPNGNQAEIQSTQGESCVRLSPWQPNGNQAEIQSTQGESCVRLSPWQPNGNQMETQVRVVQVREGEEDARAREATVPSPPATEMHSRICDHQRAEQIIRRYGLPDNDPTLDAVLEDAEANGWDKLEAALQEAALSNSRQRISVKFYRSILTAEPRKEQPNARADPYANYERF